MGYEAAVKSFIEHVMIALYPRTDELPGIEDTDLRGFLERAPGLAQQVLGRLAGAQTQVGVEVAIDLGGITLGELEQKFGGLLNKARY